MKPGRFCTQDPASSSSCASSRMPLASSIFGWDDQSLQTMQWSRLVTGAGRLG